MIKFFLLTLSIMVLINSCILFRGSNYKTKSTTKAITKYSFAVVDSSVFFNCGQLRYNPGHWYNEYFDGICRNDSIVIIYHRNNKSYLDTVATYDPCNIIKPLHDTLIKKN